MDRRLESWYNSIRAYMNLITYSLIYRGSVSEEDATEVMTNMGFTDVNISWYDGIILNGKRDGCSFGSAWCANNHTIQYDSPKYNFFISIHEYVPNDEHLDRPDEPYSAPENNFKYSQNGVVLGDIPETYMEFMKKIVDFCDEMTQNDPLGIHYYARFCLDN